jgi:hypothetical protein
LNHNAEAPIGIGQGRVTRRRCEHHHAIRAKAFGRQVGFAASGLDACDPVTAQGGVPEGQKRMARRVSMPSRNFSIGAAAHGEGAGYKASALFF